ncbi:unnamed protein product [Prorocentrum cordatum]|uniref:Uncharacterized protein n=1 Tax=Prorocentrum cordatum TaxID=2364126 RepID=A0ABN9QWV8_9DINO|nr:unnamed protein product [Polarella glacialis]
MAPAQGASPRSASGISSSVMPSSGLSVAGDVNVSPTLGQIQTMMEQMMTRMTTMTNSMKTYLTKRFDEQIGDIRDQIANNKDEIHRGGSLASGAQEGLGRPGQQHGAPGES